MHLKPDQISALCDTWGMIELGQEQDPIDIDAEYFESLLGTHETKFSDHVIVQEMCQYLCQYAKCTEEDLWKHFQKPGIDVLEVYCSAESELTQQANYSGLIARRFGLRQGDLATFAGRCALYEVIWKGRPRHIWMSPKCGPWSNWNRLNRSKSLALEAKINHDRRSENIHLQVCSGLFAFQLLRGPAFHSQLEQPAGSELLDQKEMSIITKHAIRALCDMCTAGRLIHPNSTEPMRKRTQIWTTSAIVHRAVEQYHCTGNHIHDTIQGTCKPFGKHRMPLSQYTELYTAVFAKRVARMLSCSLTQRESQIHPIESLQSERMSLAAVEDENAPVVKRRRLSMKTPSPDSTRAVDSEVQTTICDLVSEVEKIAPKVGKAFLEPSHELCQRFQDLFPSHQIRVIDVCKGADRLRTPPIRLLKGEAPLRLQCGRDRGTLEPFCEPSWEEWESLSQRQKCRKGKACRLSITLFGRHRSSITCQESQLKMTEPQKPSTQSAVDEKPDETETVIPQNPKTHGTKFKMLSKEHQTQLIKMHANLGHPDSKVFANALRDHGWSQDVQEAIGDMHCDICHEHQKPKISRPSHLREPRDFNDLVSFDGTEWVDEHGKNTVSFA